MSINGQIILEETEHEPTEEEIYEYAKLIGINPEIEPELMVIAKKGIEAPLPEPWRACRDESGFLYYFNFSTGESLWDHPMDGYYKELVEKERKNNLESNLTRNLRTEVSRLSTNIFTNIPSNIDTDDLKIISNDKIEQFFNDSNMTDYSDNQSAENLEINSSDSKSEDYGKDVNFGLDKSLADRISKSGEIRDFIKPKNPIAINSNLCDTLSSNKSFKDTSEMLKLESVLSDIKEEQNNVTIEKENSQKMLENDKIKIQEEFKKELEEYKKFLNEKFTKDKEKITQEIKGNLQLWERNETLTIKNELEKKIATLKLSINSDYEKEKQKLDIELKEQLTKLKSDNKDIFQRELDDLFKDFNVNPLKLTKDNYEQIKQQLNKLCDQKIAELKATNKKKLEELTEHHKKELKDLELEFANDKERMRKIYELDLKHCQEQNQIKLNQIQEEQKSLDEKLEQVKLRKKEEIDKEEGDIEEIPKSISVQERLMEINRIHEVNTNDKLRLTKTELVQVKKELIEKVSELSTVKNEIEQMKSQRAQMQRDINRSDAEVMVNEPRELYDSAVLIDDAGLSLSYDDEEQQHKAHNHKTYRNHLAENSPNSIIDKAKRFLSKCETTLKPAMSYQNRCTSLPSELDKVETGCIPNKQSTELNSQAIIPSEFVNSLQKITMELDHIVKSLNSTSYSTSKFSEENLPVSKSNLMLSLSTHDNNSSTSQHTTLVEDKLKKIYRREEKFIYATAKSYKQAVHSNHRTSSERCNYTGRTSQNSNLTPRNAFSNTDEQLNKHKSWLNNFKIQNSQHQDNHL